jgi:hypothetical protein
MQVKGFNGTATFDGTFVTITRTGFRARISVGSGWGSRPALDSAGSPRASIPSRRLLRRSSPRVGVVHRMRCSTFPLPSASFKTSSPTRQDTRTLPRPAKREANAK